MSREVTTHNKLINRAILISGLVFLTSMFLGYYLLKDRDATSIWRTLLVNYLFFTSATAGLTVWPAIVLISNGKWMGSLEKLSQAGISFSLPSLIVLFILYKNSPEWAPWYSSSKPWLDNTFLFSRNMILQVIFWLFAVAFLFSRRKGNNTVLAGILILWYVITFSVAGFDFVMALDPEWHSMMMGGYFFTSALYIALALWALLAVFMRPAEKSALHDIGNLTIAFCMLTSYLMFSQLLPIWYENMPEETRFLVGRMNLAWKYISMALLVLVYLGPVLFLLNRWVKENRIYMGVISLLILTGMWIERWWLVSAELSRHKIEFGLPDILVTAIFISLTIGGIFTGLRFFKEPAPLKTSNA